MRYRTFAVAALVVFACGLTSGHARIGGISAQNFAQMIIHNENFQIQAARIILERSRNENARKHAAKTIEQRSASADAVRAVARRAKIPLPGLALTWRQRRIIERLRKMDSARLDRYYFRTQRKSNTRIARLLQSYAASGDNEELRRLAKESLPGVFAQASSVKSLIKANRRQNGRFRWKQSGVPSE